MAILARRDSKSSGTGSGAEDPGRFIERYIAKVHWTVRIFLLNNINIKCKAYSLGLFSTFFNYFD